MSETEVDVYKLNSEERQQSFRISIINNEQISMILTNITTDQKYTASVSLPQLRKVCQVFMSINNIKEAIQILKETIEGGNIELTEDPEKNIIELNYKVIIEDKEFPPFEIHLGLEKENNEEEVQVLPPKFDYQGNKEAENKYGNTTDNTTEFIKPIVQSNVKPPILQLEYIEPILQVHYPDGTTKSTALPPRIQGVDGKTPNITEEQFKSIQEQMNKNSTIKNFSPLKDFLNQNRSNSVAPKNISSYSTQSTPYPATNNLTRVNPFSKAADPDENQNQNQNNLNPAINNVNTAFNTNGQNNYLNNLNNNLNKTSSGFSIMTMQVRPFPSQGMNNANAGLQNNNLNQTNIFQRSNILNQVKLNQNHIIERRPRMIEQNRNNPRDVGSRSQSLPSNENMHKFNPYKNQNIYQSNLMNNPFKTNTNKPMNNINNNNNEKYPYDRNTQRIPNRNNLNNMAKIPHNQQSRNTNLQQMKIHSHQNSQKFIQQQQQRLEEIKRKLAEIQMEKKQIQERQNQLYLQQRQNKRYPNNLYNNNPNLNLNQQIRQKIQVMPNQPVRQFQSMQNQQNPLIRKAQSQSININQNQLQFQNQQQIKQPPQYQNKPPQQMIRHTNSLTNNNQQFLQHQTSQEIKQTKTSMNNSNQKRNQYQYQNKFKTQISSPIPSQAPTLGNKDISQQLISLAQMASMQNEANPNFKNLQAITLEQQEQQTQQEQHININEQQQEQEEIQEYNPQEELAQQQQYQYQSSSPEEKQDINIEALFFTEDGRVIFRNGLLRGIIHKYAEIDDVVSKIQDKLMKGVKFNLVYKAFDVGDRAKDFHGICDKLNMSLVLIETDKDIRFGGFTTESWEGHCLKKKDNNAFVFSLETNKIFDIIPEEPAIGCYPKFGPVFFGCQIRIYDEFFTKGGTTCHKGLNYKTTEDYELNNGEQKYLIKDIEIYSIETIDI